MRQFFTIAFISVTLLLSTAHAEDQCQIAREAIKQASIIRGLKIKKLVPCLVHTQDQVKEFILSQLRDEIPAKKLALEELAFKALGVIPDDFEYSKGLVDLYLGQLGGYYDPKKEHFVMAGWMPVMMQPTIAAHELTHALQDQYYNLDALIDHKIENSDRLLAHSALVEGDATAVMMDYLRGLSGQPGISTIPDVNSILLQNALGASFTSGLNNVPQSLQLFLLFPYTSGLRFAHTLLLQGGYREIDKAFKNPPRTTEEILHPEKYSLATPDYIEITNSNLAAYATPNGQTAEYQDSYGEFGISVLLGSFITDKYRVTDASNGWGGDRVGIFSGPSRQVVWLSAWDTQKDADEFLELYKESLNIRFPTTIKKGESFATPVDASARYQISIKNSAQQVAVIVTLRE